MPPYDRESIGDYQRKDGNLGMISERDSVGESKGGIGDSQTSRSTYSPQYMFYLQGPGYLIGGSSDYFSYQPYPSYMPFFSHGSSTWLPSKLPLHPSNSINFFYHPLAIYLAKNGASLVRIVKQEQQYFSSFFYNFDHIFQRG